MIFKLPLKEKYYDFFIPREIAFLVYPLNVWRRSLVKGFLKFSRDINLTPDRILEVGCGNGFFTRLLSYRFPEASIISIDTSQKLIDHASKRNLSNVSFRKADFFNIDGSFDLIVSLHVFILLDTEKAFEKLSNLLSDRGTAFLTYTEKTLFTELHRRFYKIVVGDRIEFKTENSLIKSAHKHGFKSDIIKLNYQEGSFALILKKSRIPMIAKVHTKQNKNHLFRSG